MPVAFLGVLHQPTRQRLPLKRVTRLVVLPDYQGIGIGRAFLDAIAELYLRDGFMFEIKTSARNLVASLRAHPERGGWTLHDYSTNTTARKRILTFGKGEQSTIRNSVKIATFRAGGAWRLHDYAPTHKPSGGRVDHSASIRSDAKVATFRLLPDGMTR